MKKDNSYYMKLSLKLALKAKGATSPNPLVGAVVVKNDKVIGWGFHEKAGLAHAEVKALEMAGSLSRGATLYVTLEPCAHFGRTPPCVDKVIESGIKKVFVSMVDPNPLNNGKGVDSMRKRNIKVETGLLENESRKMNESFIKYITRRLPLITVKIAQSLDGKIATKSGDSKWITSDKSRSFAHRLRGGYDAVMVGVNTVLRDNPRLNAWFFKTQPKKIIVDSRLSAPQEANIFSSQGQTIIITLPTFAGQETENKKNLSAKAKIIEVKEKAGQVNLKNMMRKLAQEGITNILVEGGGTLIGALFDEGLVDKVLFFISPKIIGGKESLSSVMGRGISRVEKAIKLKEVKLKRIGEDFLVEGNIKSYV